MFNHKSHIGHNSGHAKAWELKFQPQDVHRGPCASEGICTLDLFLRSQGLTVLVKLTNYFQFLVEKVADS